MLLSSRRGRGPSSKIKRVEPNWVTLLLHPIPSPHTAEGRTEATLELFPAPLQLLSALPASRERARPLTVMIDQWTIALLVVGAVVLLMGGWDILRSRARVSKGEGNEGAGEDERSEAKSRQLRRLKGVYLLVSCTSVVLRPSATDREAH